MATRQKKSSVNSQSINQQPSSNQSSREVTSSESQEAQQDRQIMSNETLSDVNQLDAFGGDRPSQDLVEDESIQEAEDQKYNR